MFKKKLLFLLVSISLMAMNCQLETCNCEFDKEIQKESNLLLDSLIELPRKYEFWELYEELYLYEYSDKSYRFFEEDWMNEIKRIYRVSKVGSKYHLVFKDYKDGKGINQYDFYDSLAINYKIPLEDSVFWTLDRLFQENCFWTHPIKRPDRGIVLHSKSRLIEAFEPNDNFCTKRRYHFVDMLANHNENFEVIIKKFKNIVEEYQSDKQKKTGYNNG